MKAIDGFVRDMNNPGAVLNIDNAALEAYKLQKKSLKEKDNEINEIKNELQEVKLLLSELLNRLK